MKDKWMHRRDDDKDQLWRRKVQTMTVVYEDKQERGIWFMFVKLLERQSSPPSWWKIAGTHDG